jgi:hypothetical protein
MYKIGKAYVGAGYRPDPIGDKGLLSADEVYRYRGPTTKANPHKTAKSNVQANLERELKKIEKTRNRLHFRHNLHVDVID